MDATNYIKGELIGWMVNSDSFDSPPSSIYVALHDGDPSNDALDNELDPDNGAAGYSRYESDVPTDWTEPEVGDFENVNAFLFDQAEEDWPEVTHFSLWDGPTDSDNALARDSLIASVTVEEEDSLIFREGNLSGTFE